LQDGPFRSCIYYSSIHPYRAAAIVLRILLARPTLACSINEGYDDGVVPKADLPEPCALFSQHPLMALIPPSLFLLRASARHHCREPGESSARSSGGCPCPAMVLSSSRIIVLVQCRQAYQLSACVINYCTFDSPIVLRTNRGQLHLHHDPKFSNFNIVFLETVMYFIKNLAPKKLERATNIQQQ
jgi:hypothetical protein